MKRVKIKDLGNVITGHTPPTAQKDYFGDYIPFIKPTDMVEGQKYTYVTEECFSEKGYKKYQSSLLPKGATCVVCIGTLGTKLTITHCDCFTNQSVNSIVPNQNYDSDYIFYLLKYNLSKVKNLNSGTASGREFVSKSIFEKLKVEVHENYYTQQKIASILSTYDALIENNTKRIKLLEQMAENLYKEWFVRFRFPGHENVEMENGLPKGWKRTKLSNEYKTSSGGTPSRSIPDYYENGTIPWIKTGELQDCILTDTEEYITDDAVKHSSAKLFSKGTLLMAMYGVNIGKLAITNIDATCNQACCVIMPKRIESKYYLFYYLKSIRDYLLSISFGAAQQNLSQELIKGLKIVLPKDDLINAFEQKIDVVYSQIRNLQNQNQLLTRQRDLLLPRLMSGKLEVRA